MSVDISPQEAMSRLQQHFGSREEMLTRTLTMLSMSGQPTDITFFRQKPILDVRVSTKLGAARLYGLEKKLPHLLRCIAFSNGAVASLDEIWNIHPMPLGGLSQEELDAVDLAQGEDRIGPGGETLREMICNSYHCTNSAEVDYFLRRWIAS